MTGVESSTFVPRVESSSGRLAIPADLVQRIEHWSATYGLSREEGAELVLRGSVEPVEEAALTLRAAYEARDVQTPEQVSAGLSAAEVDVPVVGMRLGPRRPATETEPFTRDHLGADLLDDALEVWPAVRGLWRMSARPRVIVAYRLGYPLAVYRVAGWEQDPTTNRRWAPAGQILTDTRRLDASTGADSGEATTADRAIFRVVRSRPLVTPPAAANPIVWLHGR